MVGWAVGEVIVGGLIFSGLADVLAGEGEYLAEPWGAFVGLFLVIWFAGWTKAGVSAAREWLQLTVGRERISVSGKEIEILEITVGEGKSRRYATAHVRNLRVARDRGSDPLAFDYGADTVRFGASMSEGEADLILEQIRQKVQG